MTEQKNRFFRQNSKAAFQFFLKLEAAVVKLPAIDATNMTEGQFDLKMAVLFC